MRKVIPVDFEDPLFFYMRDFTLCKINELFLSLLIGLEIEHMLSNGLHIQTNLK